MTEQQYLEELKTEGYRVARETEAGFWDKYVNEEGEQVRVWITDSQVGCGTKIY